MIEKVTDEDLKDFSPADDGFRTINEDGPLEPSLDTAPDAEISSKGTTLDKIDVLIAQVGSTIDSDLGLSVVTVDNLADVGFNIKSLTAPFVMEFNDMRVLREFIRRHAMFGVSIAYLKNIPDVVKDRLFDQSVWDLKTVDYPVLLDRVQSIADSQAAVRRKDEVAKRMRRREVQRVTEERHEAATDNTGFKDASGADDDDMQFEGGDNA